MILSGMQKSSKTFTDLLKITGLPRKTLSMRLTALCDSGVIVKDGGYRLNGSSRVENCGGKMDLPESQALTKPSFFTRRNVIITLMLVMIAVPIAANVSAMLFSSPSPPQPEPQYIGTFKAYIKVSNVIDLFAWQVVIYADSLELIVVDAVEGNFLKANAPYGTTFMLADHMTNPDIPNTLLVGDSLLGMDIPGVNGAGVLAIITFGYKSENYTLPKIIFDHKMYETLLLNSYKEHIQEYTLTIEIED